MNADINIVWENLQTILHILSRLSNKPTPVIYTCRGNIYVIHAASKLEHLYDLLSYKYSFSLTVFI